MARKNPIETREYAIKRYHEQARAKGVKQKLGSFTFNHLLQEEPTMPAHLAFAARMLIRAVQVKDWPWIESRQGDYYLNMLADPDYVRSLIARQDPDYATWRATKDPSLCHKNVR